MEINEFYERYWELIKYRNEFNIPKTVLNTWDDEGTIFKTDSFKVLALQIKKYNKPAILDIGAGNRHLKDTLGLMKVDFEYLSLDISTNIQHDYTNINEIDKKFDIIILL